MATTKKNETKNKSVNNKKGAAATSPRGGQEGVTKVMCPVCGTEFAIGEHEHTVKNAVAIGKDSGLGTVYLPVSKRAEALNAAGIGTKKYFAMNALDGPMTTTAVPFPWTRATPLSARLSVAVRYPTRTCSAAG